jgi:catechol 2,3-dioxygenase-like lactoylglutathione lyase family enzyme
MRDFMTSAKLLNTIPILRMYDIAKTREFYLDYLGFTVEFEHRFHEGAPLFMGISRDGVSLFLSEHHGDGSPGSHICIDVGGLDDLLRELQSKNYRFMNPGIQEQEWGTRELTVYDPVGNHITFREPITSR